MDFAKLKTLSGKKALEKLTEELNKVNENKRGDDRFWLPTTDKAGNGYAIIRFLPAPPDEDVPFIRIWDHGFQGPGGWYIENSLTTLNKSDPVSEYNSKLWNASDSDESPERKQARKQKRRLHFISNIQVVEDSGNPANNGKVFLFKYGKKIFNKLNEAMNPEFADEEAMNPFDLWAGANFKLKIRQVEGYRNYDRSEFDKPSALSNDDAELERIWKSEFSLKAFLDPSNFKSYEELSEKLNKVLTGDTAAKKTYEKAKEEGESWTEEKSEPQFKTAPAKSEAPLDDDGDDPLQYFQKLANKK
jgi:hypothetical protein